MPDRNDRRAPSDAAPTDDCADIPTDIGQRVRTMCLALPEVTVRVDDSRIATRSTAYSYDIRRRSFCLLLATKDPDGPLTPMLIVRAAPTERHALLSNSQPYFASRAGRDRLGILLTEDTDWDEIHELVTESYRRLAPKKLMKLLSKGSASFR